MSKANSIFQKWLSKKDSEVAAVPLSHHPTADVFPLSSEQIRLWIHDQLHPGNPVYNFVAAYSIKKNLDITKFTSAVKKAIAKHSLLSSAISVQGSSVVHCLNQNVVECHVEHINNGSPDEATQMAFAKAKAFGRMPFDLTKELTRILVLNLNNEEYWLVLAVHHIIFDKQSTSIFLRDVVDIYESQKMGTTAPTSALGNGNSFADYIAFGQQHATVSEPTKAYWKNLYTPLPDPISWPFLRGSSSSGMYEGNYIKIELPPDCLTKLTKIAQSHNTSLFIVILSLYKVFLSMYLDRDDICVGIPVTNRTDEKWYNTIGFFDNSLALRSKIDSNLSFASHLMSIKQHVAEAFNHADMPFQNLVKLISPSRGAANPIFQTMLIYHEADLEWTKPYPYEIREIRIDLGVSKFDLSLFCQKSGDQLELIFEASSNLFSEEKQKELKAAFGFCLQNLILNSNVPLHKFDWLNTHDSFAQLKNWNTGPEIALIDSSAFALFLQQVQKSPNAVAISDGTEQHTYAAFYEKVDTLARSLSKSGIKSGTVVGICLERSITLVTVIYALHHIGASYMPIDPEYPRERIEAMMSIAEVSTVISTRDIYNSVGFGSSLLLQDNEFEIVGSVGQHVNFENGAYILFTSGSTGKPKGVKISQANLLHSTQNRIHFYKHQPKHFLLIPSVSFDSSVAGLFWPLCTGGTLHVPPKRLEHDMMALSEYIKANKIDTTLLLPSLYKLLLQHSPTPMLASLKTVIVAGEACTKELVAMHYDLLPDCVLYNEYGPTEASVWCTACQLHKKDSTISIGKPIANTTVYLLNSNLQPVLPGHIGEIFVGGNGIADGYVNNQELTNKNFIDNPFQNSGKLYKTGDIGRFDNDGNLVFLGRKDQQIKINGKRVEIEEIVETIYEIEGTEQAVVLFQTLGSGDKPLMQQHDAKSYLQIDAPRAKSILNELMLKNKQQRDLLYANLV